MQPNKPTWTLTALLSVQHLHTHSHLNQSSTGGVEKNSRKRKRMTSSFIPSFLLSTEGHRVTPLLSVLFLPVPAIICPCFFPRPIHNWAVLCYRHRVINRPATWHRRPTPCRSLLMVVTVHMVLGSLVLCTAVSHLCCVVLW